MAMPDIPTQAEAVRRGILQPLADAAFAHLRLNCFVLAACMIAMALGLGAADETHRFLSGAWSTWWAVLDLPAFTLAVALALHLVRFQARADRRRFRVVHPVFRAIEAFCYMTAALVVPLGGLHVAVTYATTRSAGQACWAAVDLVATLVLFLGGYVASCEWRRLPPAERRERTPIRGLAAGSA